MNSKIRDFLEPITDLENAVIESKNPILEGLIDYMVEEDSAEEDYYSVAADQNLSGLGDMEIKVVLEEDRSLLKILDKLILYLRIVHSVNYYNHCEFPNEDTMPNR